MLSFFSKLLFFFSGWQVEGLAPEEKKYVIIVAPHTSNWDFVYGIAAKKILGLKTHFIGKAELFRPPFGWFFRWLGGFPVDRTRHNNLVDSVVETFKEKDAFSIALAPEGTRNSTSEFKTGFYHIARYANVPIRMVGIDYVRKVISVADPFFTTGDMARDMQEIHQYFQTFYGKYPEKAIGYNSFSTLPQVSMRSPK